MRKEDISEEVVYNELGEEVHVMNGPAGEMRIKKVDPSQYLYTGEQWCPECHIQMMHKDGYFECQECKWSITDEEAEDGFGWPTKGASYEDDYGEYYK